MDQSPLPFARDTSTTYEQIEKRNKKKSKSESMGSILTQEDLQESFEIAVLHSENPLMVSRGDTSPPIETSRYLVAPPNLINITTMKRHHT